MAESDEENAAYWAKRILETLKASGVLPKSAKGRERVVRDWLEAAKAAMDDLNAIPRPYEQRAFDTLTPEQQQKVRGAEISVHTRVSPGWAVAHIPGMREWADQFTEKYGLERSGDEQRIDEPLRAMRALAQAYADTGLAADAEAAKGMAEGFKDAMCRHWQQKDRGRRIER